MSSSDSQSDSPDLSGSETSNVHSISSGARPISSGARPASGTAGMSTGRRGTPVEGQTAALTKRQRQIFDFISDFVGKEGYSPSLEEIAKAFGLSSVATVHKHVKHLVDKGYLRKAWNRSRSVEPVPVSEVGQDPSGISAEASSSESPSSKAPSSDALSRIEAAEALHLPILGTVAAGSPIEAIEPDAAVAETLAVPESMTSRSRDSYVLRVRGDSMIEDQICDGDLVVIEGRNEARNGETVVALVDGAEATLKRFYRSGAQVKLVPANQTMEPMEFHASQVEIRGVVRGLIREF
ncbi:MAG: transcriptional repressor LexA [Myxococcota bacterium]